MTNDLQRPQNTSNPLIVQQAHPIFMCHAFTSTPCVCSPAARRGLVGLFEHQSPFDSPLQLPVPSVSPAADAPAPCVTHAAGPLGTSLQEAADTPSHFSCPLPSFTTASCLCNFLSLSPSRFPANVHSTEYRRNPPNKKKQGGQELGHALARKKHFNTTAETPHFQHT